ncbi:hypothetical protein [Arcanobacterium haemolyticum]
MTALLLVTNIATGILAIVYYVRFHWLDDELTDAHNTIEKHIQTLTKPGQHNEQNQD